MLYNSKVANLIHSFNESYYLMYQQQQEIAGKMRYFQEKREKLIATYRKYKNQITEEQEKRIYDAVLVCDAYLKEHAYVDVMPHQNRKIDPNALTVDQAYALQTKGYKRNEPKLDPSAQFSPPPATPNSDRQPNFYNAGSDPLSSVINDRLNSDERFDDYVKKQAMSSQVELNQTLAQAYQNVAHQAANKARVKNQTADRQALENWMDATGYSPGTMGGGSGAGCPSC